MWSPRVLVLCCSIGAACTALSAPDADCEGRCDTPGGGSVEMQCRNSRAAALDERRPHFTAEAVRWSCRDVNGVSASSDQRDDRGQEYCEYFTLLHTRGIPEVLFDGAGAPSFCDDVTPCAQGVCDARISACVSAASPTLDQPADVLGKTIGSNAVTPLDPHLSAGQLEWLAANSSTKVGECIFTSWHADVSRPIPACSGDCSGAGGYRLDATLPASGAPLFRMQVGFNSNGAAKALVGDCLQKGDAAVSDDFMRGCTLCGQSSCVPWRKSDPSVCTLSMKLAECGCQLQVREADAYRTLDLTKPEDLSVAKEAIVPSSRRGFTLGTWDGMGHLPTGCRYLRFGDESAVTINGLRASDPFLDQVLVACDLTGSHLTRATATDPKEACRETYGDEVVVHVRLPDPAIARVSCNMSVPGCQGVPWAFENLTIESSSSSSP